MSIDSRSRGYFITAAVECTGKDRITELAIYYERRFDPAARPTRPTVEDITQQRNVFHQPYCPPRFSPIKDITSWFFVLLPQPNQSNTEGLCTVSWQYRTYHHRAHQIQHSVNGVCLRTVHTCLLVLVSPPSHLTLKRLPSAELQRSSI